MRTDEWKLIRYPERDFNQLFNLKDDPLEMNNLSADTSYRIIQEKLFNELARWQTETGDTVPLNAPVKLPLEYDYRNLVRKPDRWQPEYTLKKYFEPDSN